MNSPENPYKHKVVGSNPSSTTINNEVSGMFSLTSFYLLSHVCHWLIKRSFTTPIGLMKMMLAPILDIEGLVLEARELALGVVDDMGSGL